MSPEYREVREYTHAVDAKAVLLAARERKLKVLSDTPSRLLLRAPISSWGFGETIEVSLAPLGGHTIVDIRSICVLRFALTDGGRNARNVRLLFEALDSRGGRACDYQPVPFCSRCEYPLVGNVSECCPECGATLGDTARPFLRRTPSAARTLQYALILTSLEYMALLILEYSGFSHLIPYLLADPLSRPVLLFIFNEAVLLCGYWLGKAHERTETRLHPGK